MSIRVISTVIYLLTGRVFFLMIRRPPRSTLDRSSAASDVYKRQGLDPDGGEERRPVHRTAAPGVGVGDRGRRDTFDAVSYTHLRAHETVLDLVCRLLLEKKKTYNRYSIQLMKANTI
mgnify:CR=1 FL=1